jgi:hypothetical protein
MIEVLVHGDFALSDKTSIVCFAEEDATIARQTLASLHRKWAVNVEKPPGPYPRDGKHVAAVTAFIRQAEDDPNWRGNGLEFDRLKPK